MKNLKSTVIAFSFIVLMIASQSCEDKKNIHMQGDEKHMQMDSQMDSTHACTMHHEMKGVKGDKCSECGMEMKENMHK